MNRLKATVPILGIVLAIFAYFYGLGGFYIPNIGDEGPYLQMSRHVVEDGMLPLRNDRGPTYTKPPLLFWQGGLAFRVFGYELAGIRLTTVIWTAFSALMAGLMTLRLGANRTQVGLAVVIFLGFFSTFRYGRPLLTNMPEVALSSVLFLSLIWAKRKTRLRDWRVWCFLGLVVGLVALYRSMAHIVLLAICAGWGLLVFEYESIRGDLRKLFGLMRWPLIAVMVGALVFSLWPLLDPDPALFYKRFVLGENLGKFDQGPYFKRFFFGSHSFLIVLFGHLYNVGAYLILLPAAFFGLWKIRDRLLDPHRREIIFLVGIVVIYIAIFILPSQRSPSYVLAGTPVLAAILALTWDRLPGWIFRISYLLSAGMFIGLGTFAYQIAQRLELGVSFPAMIWPLLVVGVFAALGMIYYVNVGRELFPLFPISFFLAFGMFHSGIEKSTTHFDLEALRKHNQPVYVPTNFHAVNEQFRYLLGGVKTRPYRERRQNEVARLLERCEIVIFQNGVGDDLPPGLNSLGSRLAIRQRQTRKEVRQFFWQRDLSSFFVRESLVYRCLAGV